MHSVDQAMTGCIDINDDHEIYIWARTFGITPDELVRWVSEVGPVASHVRDALERAQVGSSESKSPREEERRGK